MNRTRLSTLLLTLLAGLAMLSTSASAALLDNGGTTVDTATNLEWLDLTATLGLS